MPSLQFYCHYMLMMNQRDFPSSLLYLLPLNFDMLHLHVLFFFLPNIQGTQFAFLQIFTESSLLQVTFLLSKNALFVCLVNQRIVDGSNRKKNPTLDQFTEFPSSAGLFLIIYFLVLYLVMHQAANTVLEGFSTIQ